MRHEDIRATLREADAARLAALWARADAVRRDHVGDAVHLRGLVEISNICVRQCAYCGIRAGAADVDRYRMPVADVLAGAERALSYGFGTIVLQAGEDPGLTRTVVADMIRRIRQRTGLAITLSLGERSPDDLRAWRDAGADRYLLRFETSDRQLYARIHPTPPGAGADRIAQLRILRDLGYEVGSGIMVGIPGQTWDSLADDVLAFRTLDLDMIGVGPFIACPGTPLAGALGATLRRQAGASQVPNDVLTTLKVVAVTRLVCPDVNIPSTTALATLDPAAGRANGLRCGANVVMPNLTPVRYRVLYRIYPGKAGIHEPAARSTARLRALITALGRVVGTGPGTSQRFMQRGVTPAHDGSL